MICKKCKKPIPFFATKCNNCYKNTGYKLSEHKDPVEDMYERPVYTVYPDSEKLNIRGKYLDTLPDFVKMKEMEKITKTSLLKSFIKTIIMLLVFFGAMFLSLKLAAGKGIEIFLLYAFISFVISYIPLYSIFYRKNKPSKKDKTFLRDTKLHLHKYAYYANRDVFGFTVFDYSKSWEDKDGDRHYQYFYAHYEIDKRNIKTIGYDLKYAEYILTMHKPVYMHYSKEPTFEFRIADIFDDTVLSNALSCDLPPKNIPF